MKEVRCVKYWMMFSIMVVASHAGPAANAGPPALEEMTVYIANGAAIEENAGSGAGGASRPQWWAPYHSSSWPSVHHDPYNSDFTFVETFAFDQPGAAQLFWRQLGGSLDPNGVPTGVGGAIVVAGQSIEDTHGLVFMTNGKADLPHLYAFHSRAGDGYEAGDVAWTCHDFPAADGSVPASAAVVCNPLLDKYGNVYISDEFSLWSYQVAGGLNWVTPLPSGDEGEPAPLVSAVFTRRWRTPHGQFVAGVGGVTTNGDVALYRLADGSPLAPPFPLPGVLPAADGDDAPESGNLFTECLWHDAAGEAMIDEVLLEGYLQGLLGTGNAVANTPAVLRDPNDRRTTRLYVPAIMESTTETDGGPQHDVKLFRLDVTYGDDGSAVVAEAPQWTDPLPDGSMPGLVQGGKGCATSPNVSADGTTVYFGDNLGFLHAFDAATGAALWKIQVGAMYGSITTTWPENTLYVVADNKLKKFVLADRPITSGVEPDAEQDFQALADELPVYPPFPREAIAAGIAVTTPQRIYIPVALGYRITDAVGLAIWSTRSVVAILDRDLNLINTIELPDISETAAICDRDGRMYVTFHSSLSSMAHCLWRAGLFNDVLPEPLKPCGGISVYRTAP